jgi:hypothetical protein
VTSRLPDEATLREALAAHEDASVAEDLLTIFFEQTGSAYINVLQLNQALAGMR